MNAARSGELGELGQIIAAERATGKLTRSKVRAIAQATAEREIDSSDPSVAAARIEQLAPCARKLDSALRARAQRKDTAAAAAQLARIDAHAEGALDDSDELIDAQQHAVEAPFRALAARASIGSDHGPLRRSFYIDPDERVRLAALRAALDRPDTGDVRALLAVVRLDPNPLAQSLAARALGATASGEGVLGLADIYASADESLRQSIVDAWGMRAKSAGGGRELVRVVDREHGMAAIEAALVLLRAGAPAEASQSAARALLRAIETGTGHERVLAITHAPLGAAGVREALERAAHASDVRVRVAALVRLSDEAGARAELRAQAQSGVLPALLALADTGDHAAAQGLTAHLSSGTSATRLAAARALVRLGEEPRAADLLADRDPSVRTAVACSVINND